MITQKELKELLHYNPDTGIFTRLIKTASSVQIGDVAGCKHKANGYIIINVLGIPYRAHRLAWLYMTGRWPKHQVDHDDHIRHNNKWSNLFEATNQ